MRLYFTNNISSSPFSFRANLNMFELLLLKQVEVRNRTPVSISLTKGIWKYFNPIQDKRGRGKQTLANSFFPVTSTNVRNRPQNFLTFSFNPFATLVYKFKFIPSASPKFLNLNQDQSRPSYPPTPSEKAVLLVKSL